MIVGSRQDAVNAAALVSANYGGARLAPRLLTDGRYALPESVLTDPECSDAHSLLSDWDIESSPDFRSTPALRSDVRLVLSVDGKLLYQTGRRGSITMPAPDVFRFELQPNDFAGEYDYGWDGGINKRHCKLEGTDTAGANDVIWQSFCMVLGDTPGFASAQWANITGWHSVDHGEARSGLLQVECDGGVLEIFTRSSASTYPSTGNGIPVVHYSTTIPAKGVKTYIVLQATFGEEGHLNAWINGSQVVDADTPIGYYGDLVEHPEADLGYPHYGSYTDNLPSTEVVYLANIEWGTDDLSDRITSPLSVPDLTW